MDVGKEPPEVPAPSEEENENPVKTEPMEQEPSETPPEEPSTVEPSASTAEDAAKEIKDEPMDEITPKEESLEATPEVQDDEKSQEASSEVPEVKVEPPTEETTDEMNTSLGNLTADAGVTSAPSFPSVGIKITITSQVSLFSEGNIAFFNDFIFLAHTDEV